MDRQILNITANEQALTVDEPIKISTNKVNYIEAHFDLGQNWAGYDSIRAVWFNDFYCISTVLDSQGVCFVPSEVMKRNGKVKVNLVGSISEDNVLTDRLTSYPVVAVIVDCTAQINGAETAPITPSQFEQYVAIVRGLVNSVKDIDHIELNSDYTLTIYYSDGTSDTTTSIRGADGNGIASVTKTGTSGLVDTYTITFTDGQTTTFTVTNGAKGDTGNGIQSIAKTSTVGLVDTYTITYTNGTTSSFTVTNGEKGEKGDTGEVSLSQLYSILPTDTASGDIASFSDGADDVPMVSVVADIEPIQDLNGYDKPWSGGAGVNILDPNLKFTAGTYYGVTLTTADGYNFSLSGTGTDSGNISAPTIPVADCVIYPAGTYTSTGAIFSTYKPDGAWYANRQIGTWTADEPFIIRSAYVQIVSGTAPSTGNRFLAMAKGSTAPTSWTPYSNICPIYGHTQSVVEQRGKNLADYESAPYYASNIYFGGYYANDDAVVDGSLYLKAGSYVISASRAITAWYLYDATAHQASVKYNNTTFNFTLSKDMAICLRVYISGTNYKSDFDDCDFQLELGSTATSYEPYQGNTTTTQFGQTVYGGSVDLVSGVLKNEMGKCLFDGTETWSLYQTSFFYATKSELQGVIKGNEDWTTSNGIVVKANTNNGQLRVFLANNPSLTTSSNMNEILSDGTHFVYELATPTTIQLTPQEIDSLLGTNTMWTDGDGLSIEYRADIGLYIQKQLS